MKTLEINARGQLTYRLRSRTMITPSPIGILIQDKTAYSPVSASVDADLVTVHYPCGQVQLQIRDCGSYHKLTVLSVPAESQTFIFGPYATSATSCGEVLGAAWYPDESVVCIQSLMPKVEGGIQAAPVKNESGVDLMPCNAAACQNGYVTLQCSISDHSTPAIVNATQAIPRFNVPFQVIADTIPGSDALIEGAAIALIAAESPALLLDAICEMEVAEGLPHPLYEGQWAKTNKRVTSNYLVFDKHTSMKEQLKAIKQSGTRVSYLSDAFNEWGHFPANEAGFSDFEEALKSHSMSESDITLAVHTLSNFITTGDSYVTPIPHKNLLVMDRTLLTSDITTSDTEIPVRDENNYATNSTLNVLRIGDELITFKAFDAQRHVLTGCTRGAFGTAVAPHCAGQTVSRLWDHHYRTLFPDLALQGEMADHLSNYLLDHHIGLMSFDGLEGCRFPGAGQYGPAEYVRRVFHNMDNKLVCDASISSNYLWHALSYNNWGEPWWDHVRRGGMHTHRVNNLDYFKRNLIPPMFGWYAVYCAKGKFEATPPENMEFMLSRSVAFDAGIAVSLEGNVLRNHGLISQYLDYIRLWEDFRFNADIPASVREEMQEEDSNWHLEKTPDGWNLTSLFVRTIDMGYKDWELTTEVGIQVGVGPESTGDSLHHHRTTLYLDAPPKNREETLHFRIRVGRPGHGRMYRLRLSCRYVLDLGDFEFRFDAGDGDYLEYNGGTQLYHYDSNFNLKGIYRCNGNEIRWGAGPIVFYCEYDTDSDCDADYLFTEFRRKKIYRIPRK